MYAIRSYYVMEKAIQADYALVKCHMADKYGNLVYNKTARNFGPVMCMAAKTRITSYNVCYTKLLRKRSWELWMR